MSYTANKEEEGTGGIKLSTGSGELPVCNPQGQRAGQSSLLASNPDAYCAVGVQQKFKGNECAEVAWLACPWDKDEASMFTAGTVLREMRNRSARKGEKEE